MWIKTVSGWKFFEVTYNEQGFTYIIKEIEGKTNF